jgi:hypothetical protein
MEDGSERFWINERLQLQRERGRSAAGSSPARFGRVSCRLGERHESNYTAFGRDQNHRTVEYRPGGTHPGAEQSAVGGCLMLGMVSGMFGRLCLSQTADGQDTEHQHDRDELTGYVHW